MIDLKLYLRTTHYTSHPLYLMPGADQSSLSLSACDAHSSMFHSSTSSICRKTPKQRVAKDPLTGGTSGESDVWVQGGQLATAQGSPIPQPTYHQPALHRLAQYSRSHNSRPARCRLPTVSVPLISRPLLSFVSPISM